MKNKVDSSLKDARQGSSGSTVNFEEAFSRMQKALGTTNDTEIAKKLGITQQSIYGARKRNQIPYAWFVKLAEENHISVDWLLFGEGFPGRNDRMFTQRVIVTEEEQQKLAQTAANLLKVSQFLHQLIDKKENKSRLTDEEKNKLRDFIERGQWKDLKDAIWEAAKLLLMLIPAMRE